MPDSRYHHITRIDITPNERHPRRHPTHGWQVRARRGGERLSKFFADARYEGREPALEAAVTYRDELLAELPATPAVPRKAWSNTGVIGLSVREKDEGLRPKLYVQLNWIDERGRRRASSFSVEKWGLRRALWNGCLRLYRERDAAGYPVEEAHVMFAKAQEPFMEQIRAEERAAAKERRAEEAERRALAAETEASAEAATPAGQLVQEDNALRRLEDALFG